jgi:sugar lactone lactonase YvrE
VRLTAGVGALALAVVAQGCKSSTGPNPKTTATLIVTLGTAPPSTSPLVVVAGPNGDTTDVGSTDTLVGLEPGTYTVASAGATTSSGIVSLFYSGLATGSPATIAAGDTAVISIRFEARAGSGGLWVTSLETTQALAAQYTSAQLTTGAAAGISLSVAGAYGAFDAAGDLWVGDSGANTLTEYAAAQLAATGSPGATVSITSPALAGPVGLAFDQLGDLWVSNFDANTVVEFGPNQLRRGGNLTPAIVVSGLAFDGPARMSFDTSGNLWVANTLSSTVVALAPSSLTSSGTPLPAITLTSDSGSLNGPSGLAFDELGDLWVANSVGGTIVAFNSSQIASSARGTVPYETLFLPSTTAAPTAIAFDNSGDLWTNSTTGAAIFEYTGTQLAAGDSVPPALVLNVAGVPVNLVFDPPPDSLPLPGSLGGAAVGRAKGIRAPLRRR